MQMAVQIRLTYDNDSEWEAGNTPAGRMFTNSSQKVYDKGNGNLPLGRDPPFSSLNTRERG
jgi:hypothetical protein